MGWKRILTAGELLNAALTFVKADKNGIDPIQAGAGHQADKQFVGHDPQLSVGTLANLVGFRRRLCNNIPIVAIKLGQHGRSNALKILF